MLLLVLLKLLSTTPNPCISQGLYRRRAKKTLPVLGVAIFTELYNNRNKGNKYVHRGKLLVFYHLIYTMLKRTYTIASYMRTLRGTPIRALFQGYYTYYSIYYYSRPYLTIHSELMGVILRVMGNNQYKVGINYYLIHNEQITANMLATYIG